MQGSSSAHEPFCERSGHPGDAVVARCPRCQRRLLAGAACPSHPAEVAEPMRHGPAAPVPVPPAIAGMPVVGVLGQGGFGTVYLARRHQGPDAPEIAVKVARARGDLRLLREATILCRVGPPATPRFIDQGTHDGHPYLAMEYLGVDSLARRLAIRPAPRAPADPHACLPLIQAVCAAAARVHERGRVVHRDLKPENIFLRPDGQAALIDFGLSFARRGADLPALTLPGERLGTPHYMAPEQWTGAPEVDERADIYALGVLLFELLTGRPPFVGDTAALRHGHLSGQCPRPSALVAVPRAVDDVVLRCLAKRREVRFARATDIASALAAALRSVPAPSPAGAPRRGQHLTGGLASPRAVALLAIHTGAATPEITRLAAQADAVLARVDGARHILALPWAPSAAAGVRRAVSLAADIARSPGATGPGIIHVADVRLRHRPGRVRLAGPALDQPAAWIAPVADRPGLHASVAAAPHVDAYQPRPVPGAPGFVTIQAAGPGQPGVDPETAPLRGQGGLLRDLVASIRACHARSAPVLCTVQGAQGLGKTRVLGAVAHALGRATSAELIHIRARAAHRPYRVLDELCRRVLRLCNAPVSMDDLDAAWASLGCMPRTAERWAVALLLGAAEVEDAARPPVLHAPGALRHAAARALATALVRRARRAPITILLDDAHAADHAALDALERATMDEIRAPLAVCVAARPHLRSLRPRWGDRAAHSRAWTLAPLEREDARALLADLLRPVEFVPEPVLDRLHGLAGGVPLHLCLLARAIRDSGAIRRHRGASGHFLAADELLAATDMPLDQRLAGRALASVPAPYLPLVELCAAAGDELTVEDVRGVQAALAELHPGARAWSTDRADRADSADCAGNAPGADSADSADSAGNAPGAGCAGLLALDAAAGLSRLARLGVVELGERGHAMRPLLAHAIEARIPPARRAQLHAALLRHAQTCAEIAPQRVAHHAACCGDSALAAATYLALGEESLAQHRYVDAEHELTLALEHARPDAPERERALRGRGQARCRLHRLADAIEDLRGARARAEARGDHHAALALLLEEATLLDWCHDTNSAAALVAQALPRIHQHHAHHLRPAADLAMGRIHYRREDLGPAVRLLERAARAAAARGDYQTRVVALLLLAPALAYLDRCDEAEARFDEVMALCRQAGDEFNLTGVHINRQVLWMKRSDVARAVADLEDCVRLSRRLGNAQRERPATFNLAELFYFGGAFARALPLARRSRDLQLRFVSEPVFDDALLLARILWRQDADEAQAYLTWLDTACDRPSWPPRARVLRDMMAQVMHALGAGDVDTAAWRELARQAEAHAPLDEHREIVITAVELACHLDQPDQARAWLPRALDLASGSALWTRRLAASTRHLARGPRDHDRAWNDDGDGRYP